MNTTDSEPFYKATEDILGENHVYPMVAYGRLKASGAFRMVCRAKNIPMNEYNEFAKSIGDTEEDKLLNHSKFGEIYKASQHFNGIIESMSIHPCSYLVYDEPIDEEIGLTKSGDYIVCNITSDQSDKWKFLKEDFLETDDIKMLEKVEQMGNIETPSVRELINLLDNNVWKLYEDRITATLNQASTDHSKSLVGKYKPKNFAELSSFVSAIRPNFSSLLDGFLNRVDYSTGIPELDSLFEKTGGYILYQENIMQFLIHLGVPEDEAYSILKRIAKKDETLTAYLNELEGELYNEWCDKGYNKDKFKDAWNVVLNSVGYGFNASHALSTAIISLYQAYYKRKYPLEYYSVTLDMYQKDLDKTNDLVSELPYFNIKLNSIKFGKSKGMYSPDKENNDIYKGIASIKYLNSQVGDELYELAQNNSYNSFISLLNDINDTSTNSRQMKILIKLDYFRDFGEAKTLYKLYKLYDNWYNRSQFHKNKNQDDILNFIRLGVSLKNIKDNSDETKKLYKKINFVKLLRIVEEEMSQEDFKMSQKIKYQQEYLGYVNFSGSDDYEDSQAICLDINTKYSPKIYLMSLGNGVKYMAKVKKKKYKNLPISSYDVINVIDINKKFGWKKDGDDNWIKDTSRTEWWLNRYDIVEYGEDDDEG